MVGWFCVSQLLIYLYVMVFGGGNVQKSRLLKVGVFVWLAVFVSFTFVMYALAYDVKREVVYSGNLTVEAQSQRFDGFYLSSPAVMFEVKVTVSEGSIKWAPYSAVLFEDTLGCLPSKAADDVLVQGWECETSDGTVKWRVDTENLDQVWYLSFINDDLFNKEVSVEVTKLWSEQNYQDWI